MYSRGRSRPLPWRSEEFQSAGFHLRNLAGSYQLTKWFGMTLILFMGTKTGAVCRRSWKSWLNLERFSCWVHCVFAIEKACLLGALYEIRIYVTGC